MARLLSAAERGGDEARDVGRAIHSFGGDSYTVGITGAPGAGKSTLVGRLVGELTSEPAGEAATFEVAVLAIDPSSPFTRGALLGDRVRMHEHDLDPRVFIRSMATRGQLGGLAPATRDAVRVLDAVGFKWILVETVGVGQVELEVAGEADTTVVVVNPGWGDEIQAAKAGLLEVADIFALNKADRAGAAQTRRDLELMLDMTKVQDGSWVPPVIDVVATAGEGVGRLADAIRSHLSTIESQGVLRARRETRMDNQLAAIIASRLHQLALDACSGDEYEELREDLVERRIDPYEAAERLMRAAALG